MTSRDYSSSNEPSSCDSPSGQHRFHTERGHLRNGQAVLFSRIPPRWMMARSVCRSLAGYFECIVPFVRASMEVPVLIDRPQLFGRNKSLQAFYWRNGFVVSLFGRRTSCRSILIAEPVIRWPPHVRTRHVNTAPGAIDVRDGIHHGVLPMFFFQDLVIIVQDGVRRQTIASVGP